MAFQDVIQNHITAGDQASVLTAVGTIESLLRPYLRNLSDDENSKYGSINETNKLLVNKVMDYRNTQPALSSPDVDWAEFALDATDRKFLETLALRIGALVNAATETRRLHDYDNYQNSLIDYDYSQYKDRTSPGLGYDSKVAEMKQFFPNG